MRGISEEKNAGSQQKTESGVGGGTRHDGMTPESQTDSGEKDDCERSGMATDFLEKKQVHFKRGGEKKNLSSKPPLPAKATREQGKKKKNLIHPLEPMRGGRKLRGERVCEEKRGAYVQGWGKKKLRPLLFGDKKGRGKKSSPNNSQDGRGKKNEGGRGGTQKKADTPGIGGKGKCEGERRVFSASGMGNGHRSNYILGKQKGKLDHNFSPKRRKRRASNLMKKNSQSRRDVKGINSKKKRETKSLIDRVIQVGYATKSRQRKCPRYASTSL